MLNEVEKITEVLCSFVDGIGEDATADLLALRGDPESFIQWVAAGFSTVYGLPYRDREALRRVAWDRLADGEPQRVRMIPKESSGGDDEPQASEAC